MHLRPVGTGLAGGTLGGGRDVVTRRLAPVAAVVVAGAAEAKLGTAPTCTKLGGAAVLGSSRDGEEAKQQDNECEDEHPPVLVGFHEIHSRLERRTTPGLGLWISGSIVVEVRHGDVLDGI